MVGCMRGYRQVGYGMEPGFDFFGGHLNTRDDGILFEPIQAYDISAAVSEGTSTRLTLTAGHEFTATAPFNQMRVQFFGGGEWTEAFYGDVVTVTEVDGATEVVVAMDSSALGAYAHDSRNKVTHVGFDYYYGKEPNYTVTGTGCARQGKIHNVDFYMQGPETRTAGYGVANPADIRFLDQAGYKIAIYDNSFSGFSTKDTDDEDEEFQDWFADHRRNIVINRNYDSDPENPRDGWLIVNNVFGTLAQYRVMAVNSDPRAIVIDGNYYRPQCKLISVGGYTYDEETYNAQKVGVKDAEPVVSAEDGSLTDMMTATVFTGDQAAGVPVVWIVQQQRLRQDAVGLYRCHRGSGAGLAGFHGGRMGGRTVLHQAQFQFITLSCRDHGGGRDNRF